MSELLTVWKGTDGMIAPEKRQCKKYGWPNTDASGEVMFDNTFFRTEAEAWEAIKASAEAGVSLIGRKVIDLRERLREAEQEASNAAAEYTQAMSGYRRFKVQQGAN